MLVNAITDEFFITLQVSTTIIYFEISNWNNDFDGFL